VHPLGLVLFFALAGAPAAAEETVGTLTLDGLSYISFQDEQVLVLEPGSTIRFHFGTPGADGAVPFTIAPGDLAIPPIPVPGTDQTLQYGLAAPVSGTLTETSEGRRIEFTAPVTATLAGPRGSGTFTYTIPFSTESASAASRDGTASVSVSGMRLVEGAWYVQLVGATVNRENAVPKPGTAVYSVLSGRFDRVP
jgi:hypothetical protein